MLMILPRARDHSGGHGLADKIEPVQIGRHELSPVVILEFMQGRAALDAGVVDENVYGPLRLDLRNTRVHRSGIGDIEAGHTGFPARFANDFGGFGDGSV